MNLVELSRFYISYLLFNVGGWVYFGYLLYYTNHITTQTCNSYTKELIDVVKIFVGISMSWTSINVINITNNILNMEFRSSYNDLNTQNLYCFLILTFTFLSVSGIISLVIFGITSGMTNILCSDRDAEFGLKLSVYGVIWVTFIQILLILRVIILFLYNIIISAKLHLLCNCECKIEKILCFNIFKKYRERRIGVEPSSMPKYNTNHVTIPMPVAELKEEPKLLCCICLDNAITLLLEPCNHICICNKCHDSLVTKECPICRTKILATRKIYLANPGI